MPKQAVLNTSLFCRNADGEIVIVSKVWMTAAKGKAAVSLYVGRGIKGKALRLVHREFFDKDMHTTGMLAAARDTVAHLWALKNEVSDFVVMHHEPKMAELFHPTELEIHQHQQENQP